NMTVNKTAEKQGKNKPIDEYGYPIHSQKKEIYRPTDSGNDKDKPPKPTKYLPLGTHTCQGCGGECFNSRTGETKFTNNQETCSNCQKREFPDMDKDIDEVSDKDLSEEVILYPPQLEITNQGENKEFDLEKEVEKKEILYLRETVKELEKQLEISKQKPTNQQHPKEVKRQQKQISFLLKLHQNMQKKAEQNFQSKYGKSELDKLSNQQKDKGSTN
ncbi:13669_t:CDS:2, partial [Funneliformis geosporum]